MSVLTLIGTRGFGFNVSTLRQVEFLIEGYLLPPTMEKLRISENLLLERAYSQEKPYVTLAYVGVTSFGESNYFPDAMAYMDFFLLIYTLMSGQRVAHIMAPGLLWIV